VNSRNLRLEGKRPEPVDGLTRTLGRENPDPFRNVTIRSARGGQATLEKHETQKAKRELIVLWLFLAAVLVISLFTARLFWEKIQSP
jgi:hypothetical protein